jgi:light-harvesting protein B-800-850 beta chain
MLDFYAAGNVSIVQDSCNCQFFMTLSEQLTLQSELTLLKKDAVQPLFSAPEIGGILMASESKVWPTGLTLEEAEEVHSYLIDGTRVFGVISLLAHILVAVSTPWLG